MCASEICDIFEALAFDPLVHDKTSTPNTQNSDHTDINPYLDHNDEFAPKSDQILGAHGTALADKEAEVQNWGVATKAAPSPCIAPKSHETFEPPSNFQIPNLKVESKDKRKKFKERTAHFLHDISSIVSPLSLDIPPRWNLRDFTATMANILSGKTFKRPAHEVNFKMETQRGTPKFKRAKKLSISSIASHKTIWSAQKESTPHRIWFPHLSRQHDPPRNASTPILTPPATPKSNGDSNIKSSSSSTDNMVFENLSFPSPPGKWSGRLTPPDDRPLPRVPEESSTILRPQTPTNAPPNLSIPTTDAAPAPRFVTLSSTPFTLTSPQFRHGPIRVDRHQKCFTPEDKSLDWTAFQMAIIGVMDEREIERDEVDCRIGEAELNDITQWFSDFGLEMGKREMEERDGCIEAYI